LAFHPSTDRVTATRREWAVGVPPARRGPMGSQELVPFNISVRAGFGAVVLDLEGEFDMSEVETFRSCVDEIITSCDIAVVADLAGVTFIDASAILALLNARRCLAGEGRELRLQHFSAPVARTFELAGLTNLLGETADTASHRAHTEPPQ
jgi:anti-anti-sigma factor